MERLQQVLFWSVISAAFIGPGTIITAASSGSRFGFSLLWALLFSTIACLVLQEASARVTVVSGFNLGQAIRKQFHGGAIGLLVLFLVLGTIILGCAAYEAGNILGAVAGASLGIGFSPKILTLVIGGISALLLYFGSIKIVARILGSIVALMGGAFLITAILVKPSFADLISGTFVPAITAKSLFDSDEKNRWHESFWRYRSTCLGVLMAGIFFGLIDIKPIPAIILA